MAPVEDTTKSKRRPNFSNLELVAMVSDNKILLLGKLDNINTARRKARAIGNDHLFHNS